MWYRWHKVFDDVCDLWVALCSSCSDSLHVHLIDAFTRKNRKKNTTADIIGSERFTRPAVISVDCHAISGCVRQTDKH